MVRGLGGSLAGVGKLKMCIFFLLFFLSVFSLSFFFSFGLLNKVGFDGWMGEVGQDVGN